MASEREVSEEFWFFFTLASDFQMSKRKIIWCQERTADHFWKFYPPKGFEIKRPHKSNRGVKENKLIGADYNGFVVIWDGKQVSSIVKVKLLQLQQK